MHSDIDRILIGKDQIARRVAELAAEITADHSPPVVETDEVTIVPILTGAMIFCADLIRQIPIAMKIGLITVSSYPGKSVTSQGPQLAENRIGDLRGRHVVVVDDILDSGQTLALVVPMLKKSGAASVKTCVLLKKDRQGARDGKSDVDVQADYVGFQIPNEFVVGYGLDYNDYYRNVPDIVTLKMHVLDRG
jgi:hypoxanthine phosphoribosyltransferase